MMAAVLVIMILHVCSQTIMRPIALMLIAQTQGTAHALTKADFPFISDFVWQKRLGHALTHLDAKVSRFYAFFQRLRAQIPDVKSVAFRAKLILWSHAAYMVRSGDRGLVSEEDGGPKCDAWLTGTPLDMRTTMASAARVSKSRQEDGGDSIALRRHGISGCGFTTKPADEEGKGGDAPSLVGLDDISAPLPSLSGEQHSLLHTGWEHRRSMSESMDRGEAMANSTPVRELLKFLKKNHVKGAGGLISERALTYNEVTGVLGDVHTPYLTGGQGSAKAKTFAGAVLELCDSDIKKVKTIDLLTELQRMLEATDECGDRKIGARLRQVCAECPALAGLEELSAKIGNTKLTGGSLETMLCDVVWRCFRRVTLGCDKPRLDDWSAETSGGNPLDVFPFFDEAGDAPAYIHISEYLNKYVADNFKAPALADYVKAAPVADHQRVA